MEGNWSDFPSDWLGCGVYEHGPECLCDVKVEQPTVTVRDWVNDVWMGRQLCDVRGYCAPWTSAKLADYLSDLGKFHAALKLYGMESGSQGDRVLETDSGVAFASLMNIRDAVRNMLEKMPNPSLADALRFLGVPVPRFLDAATQYKLRGSESWTYETLDDFEEAILAHGKIADVCDRFGITEQNLYTLKDYLRPVFVARGISFVKSASPEREAARKLALDLIADGLENASIVWEVERKYGIKYSSAAISKMRVRKMGGSLQ